MCVCVCARACVKCFGWIGPGRAVLDEVVFEQRSE